MTLSVELLKRLNSNQEPLPKRLKLAENVFCAINIPIVQKEDLILQWFCSTNPIDQQVWISLKNCLKTKYLDIKTGIIKTLIKVLIETFQKDIKYMYEDIFECYTLLIFNNGVQQYFVSKPEDLGLLTKSLLECVNKIFKHTFNIEKQSTEGIKISLIDKSNGLILTAYNTIINAIESIIQIFKSASVTKYSLRTTFIHNILWPVCATIDHNCTDNRNRLGAVTHKCIQQLIFGRKHTQSREFLRDKDITQIQNLLSILIENAKTKNFQNNLMTFTFFFRVAINTFKLDTVILDIILRELVESSATYKKEVLCSLVKYLTDITFDFDNKIHDVTLFDYCQNIIDNILMNNSMSDTDYDLLAQFCYFNPLIIERKVQDILRKVFIEKSILECKYLIISILNASIHLRQEEKLISAILIVLKDCLCHMSAIENEVFFPNEFKQKLMEAVNNITNSQSVVMLRTLTYHLKNDCLEVLQSNGTGNNILMLKANVELLITVLDGICIYECSGTSASYTKFINAFSDLKNVLSLLMVKTLYLNHDKEIEILLTAIFSYNETQKTLKYYIPNTISEDLELSVTENHWQKLVENIKKFGSKNRKNNMNKFILQQVKMSQNIINKSMMLDSLIDGLKYCWCLILKFDAEVIPFLSNEQVLELTHLLLVDIISNPDSFNEWVKVLQKNDLQENRRLIIFILNDILTQIGHLAAEGITKSVSKYFSAELLLEAEIAECEKISNTLMSIKEELLVNKCIQIQNIVLCKIKVYLEVLLYLPLMFLSSNVRLITFVFMFALRRECGQSNEIIFLCNTIFSDLLEKSNINIFKYIDPPLLLKILPQNKTFQKALELFLRNCSYTSLKKFIKCSTYSNKNMFFLLESMEHVKSKLNIDQKIIIKKAEEKLIALIMKTLSFEITKTDYTKILNLILKISITNENIDEKLKNVAELTIQNIFLNDNNNKITNELMEDGLELVVVVLRNKKVFQITYRIIKEIWHILFKYPRVDVLSPLLESSEPKEFSEFLEELHNQLVKTLSNIQENNLENICIIWNVILKTNMSNDRNKLRLTAINNLIQTVQTVNIFENFWPNLLKLIQNILTTKHLYLPGYIIDTSIVIGLKSLQRKTILICNDTLALCNVLLKMRTNLIIDRIPSLLVLYRRILSIFVHKSKAINNKSEEHTLKCFALDIEKFTGSLIKLKKDMIRISPYLIADMLELFSENSITSFVKISLQNCINQLISICDQHGIALLSRTLPVSMQEIFKAQLDVYNKFYKFSGKV